MKYSWVVLPGSAESVSDGMSEMRQIVRDAAAAAAATAVAARTVTLIQTRLREAVAAAS